MTLEPNVRNWEVSGPCGLHGAPASPFLAGPWENGRLCRVDTEWSLEIDGVGDGRIGFSELQSVTTFDAVLRLDFGMWALDVDLAAHPDGSALASHLMALLNHDADLADDPLLVARAHSWLVETSEVPATVVFPAAEPLVGTVAQPLVSWPPAGSGAAGPARGLSPIWIIAMLGALVAVTGAVLASMFLTNTDSVDVASNAGTSVQAVVGTRDEPGRSPDVSGDIASDGGALDDSLVGDSDSDETLDDEVSGDDESAVDEPDRTQSEDSQTQGDVGDLSGVNIDTAIRADVAALATLEVFGCGTTQEFAAWTVGDGWLTVDGLANAPWRLPADSRLPRVGSVDSFSFLTTADSSVHNLNEGMISLSEESVVAVLGSFGTAAPSRIIGGDTLTIDSNVVAQVGAPARVRSLNGSFIGIVTSIDTPVVVQQVRTDPPSRGNCTGSVERATSAWQYTTHSDIAGLLAMQRLADAFAAGDWDLARRIDVEKAEYSDATFARGWGNLDRSFVIPLRLVGPATASQRWRIGLLGHETASRQVTTLFCVTWAVSLVDGTVRQTGDDPIPLATLDAPFVGWLAPADVDSLLEQC